MIFLLYFRKGGLATLASVVVASHRQLATNNGFRAARRNWRPVCHCANPPPGRRLGWRPTALMSANPPARAPRRLRTGWVGLNALRHGLHAPKSLSAVAKSSHALEEFNGLHRALYAALLPDRTDETAMDLLRRTVLHVWAVKQSRPWRTPDGRRLRPWRSPGEPATLTMEARTHRNTMSPPKEPKASTTGAPTGEP